MICGQMTPGKKQIFRNRSTIDDERYTAMLDRFTNESYHPGYANYGPSHKCTEPEFICDPDNTNNADVPGNREIENVFVNGTIDF